MISASLSLLSINHCKGKGGETRVGLQAERKAGRDGETNDTAEET